MISMAMLILSLFTSNANAQVMDLNGTWTGSGISYSYHNEEPIDCSNFIFEFRQTASELELLHGEVSCKYGPQQYLPFIAEIKDYSLLSEDPNFTGSITKEFVTATWVNPYDDNSESTMMFKLINGEIHYSDVARTNDGKKWFRTFGILKKIK